MPVRKHLIVDCQVFQTGAWDRGMGKYLHCLLGAIHKQESLEVTLLFNTSLPASEAMKKSIEDAFSNFSSVWIELAHPDDDNSTGSLQDENIVRLDRIVEQEGWHASYFFIPSLFSWPTCPVFPSATINVALMHDIIPLLYFERYFPSMRVADYLAQFRILFEADLIVTNSESVRDDMLVYLGIEPRRVKAINGGPIIVKEMLDEFDDAVMRKMYRKPFILMPTGNDLRKNNMRCAEAFQRFLETSGGGRELVVTSFFSDEEKQALLQGCSAIRFTDNVTDQELAWLFSNSDCVLFASESEGLGMPLLEAVGFNKAVVSSDIPVFQEISQVAFKEVDPFSVNAIHEALEDSAASKFSLKSSVEYKRIKSSYTWAASASIFTESLGGTLKVKREKRRIAVLGPVPSGYSAIGKTLIELHPALSRLFTVDYYFEKSIIANQEVRPNYLPYVARCDDVSEFSAEKYRDYDGVIYHMGNSENHLITAQHALAFPGITIMHDTHMPNIYKFLSEEGYISHDRRELEEQLNKLVSSNNSSYITSIANSQLANVVHSEFSKAAVEDLLELPARMQRSNLSFASPSYNVQKRTRPQKHIGLGGILASVKGLDLVERIASSPDFSDCIINIFGFNFAEKGILERLEQYDNIRLATNLTDYEFQSRLASLNVLLNYRLEYRGETSCTVLEAMRYGVIPIVRNIGWYGELPDHLVVKVDALDDVLGQLKVVLYDDARRLKMSEDAKQFIESSFLHEYYANDIYELIDGLDNLKGLNATIARGLKNGTSHKQLLSIVEKEMGK